MPRPHPSANHDIVTPEAVALEVPIAGLGSRVMAATLDVIFQTIVLGLGIVAAVAVADLIPNEALAIVLAVGALLLILAGYYLLFEGLWEGQTPGKRLVGLQVVTDLGQPITWRHVTIRTLFRIIDMLPVVGAPFVLMTRRSQRLGDLAAGTLVVRRHTAPEPNTLEFGPNRERDELAQSMDTSGVSDGDYALIRSFLGRRASLTPRARAAVAAKLADTLKARAGIERQGLGDEPFLEAVIVSRRLRSGRDQGS
jgi:uncharacterized RDD family membrane protein YckC